jgi:hypothetical protein
MATGDGISKIEAVADYAGTWEMALTLRHPSRSIGDVPDSTKGAPRSGWP